MKNIIKNPEPTTLVEWKSNWPDLVPGWNEFDSNTKQTDGTSIKHKVKMALLEEQGGLCCFCESEVSIDCGHIAHLLDRNGHPELALEYDNLLYSCPENEKRYKIPQTCGHAQGNRVLPITPLADDCEQRFIYTATGAIAPRDENDVEAKQTIEILNLNDRKAIFRKHRAKAFQTVDEARQEKSPAEFEHWIDAELKRQSDGTFKPYWTTIKFAAGYYTPAWTK